MSQSEENSIQAAERAIDAHTQFLRLDDEGDRANIGMWHLLRSLIEYSDANHLDFDLMVEEVCADLRINRT